MALAAQVRSDKLPHKTHLSLIYFVCQKLVVLRQMPGMFVRCAWVCVIASLHCCAERCTAFKWRTFRWFPSGVSTRCLRHELFSVGARNVFFFASLGVCDGGGDSVVFIMRYSKTHHIWLTNTHTHIHKQGNAVCVSHSYNNTKWEPLIMRPKVSNFRNIRKNLWKPRLHAVHMACSTSFTTDYYYYNGSFFSLSFLSSLKRMQCIQRSSDNKILRCEMVKKFSRAFRCTK